MTTFFQKVFTAGTEDHPGQMDISHQKILEYIRDSSQIVPSLNKVQSTLDGFKQR